MKKFFVLTTLVLTIIAISSFDVPVAQAFWRTYDDGYEEGYQDGYDEGYSTGFDNGYEDGQFSAYADRRDYEDVFVEYLFAEDLIKLVIDHCDDPVEYIAVYYAPYWGEFTKVYGDICFGTIPDDLRHLIHYPPFDSSRVFVVEGGRSYHAKPYCYTLLRTKEGNIRSITLQAAVNSGYSPCSKCVSPDATQ